MNEYSRHAARRLEYHGPGVGHSRVKPTGLSSRIVGLALMGVALTGPGGCTFVEQTDDLFKGGPEQRIDAAKERQSDAVDQQQRLKRTHEELIEQQSIEEQKLHEMRSLLESQNARLERARESRRITETRQRDLQARVSALAGEIGDLEFRIQAARAVGETTDDAQLNERLQDLRSEAERIEEEIRTLEE